MFQYAIALTGGIATGKSTVASFFKMYGFLTIDADKIAHNILDNNYIKIKELFGDQYIQENKVNRAKLGNLIFNDQKQKQKLEEYIHPLIKQQIINQAKNFEQQQIPYLIDLPLFFEKRNYDIKKSIVVYTPKDIQIKRLCKRENYTEQEALIRINNQIDIEEKRKLATYIIDNTHTLKELHNEVLKVKQLILQK